LRIDYFTNNKKNLRSRSESEADFIFEYINIGEKIKKTLYKIDTSQISSINGKKINTASYIKFKDLVAIAKFSQPKDKFSYLNNIKIFDYHNHFSFLIMSILAGGLMGMLVVACISINHDHKRLDN